MAVPPLPHGIAPSPRGSAPYRLVPVVGARSGPSDSIGRVLADLLPEPGEPGSAALDIVCPQLAGKGDWGKSESDPCPSEGRLGSVGATLFHATFPSPRLDPTSGGICENKSPQVDTFLPHLTTSRPFSSGATVSRCACSCHLDLP